MTAVGLPVPAPLRDAIDGFAGRHPELAHPDVARDQCRRYSRAFAREMDLRGDVGDCEVISGLRMSGWAILGGHFAVRVGGLVIDWTYRQFDPAAAVPRVTSLAEWRAEWTAVSDVTSARARQPALAGGVS